MSDMVFSNEVSEVSEGEATHSPCCVPRDVDCKISSVTFWNTSGIHPHDFLFSPPPSLYTGLWRGTQPIVDKLGFFKLYNIKFGSDLLTKQKYILKCM